MAEGEAKGWLTTFVYSIVLFLALYLTTLWFGSSLVGH